VAAREELPTAAPADVGFSADTLARAAASADDAHRDLGSLLVARNGRLVLEAYFNGAERDTRVDVRSVGKSITGTLVGIALDEGRFAGLEQPAASFFAADVTSGAPLAGITLRHLLEMRSGLDADDWWESPESAGTEAKLEAASDRTSFALQVPKAAAPGERWQYSSVNTLLLGRAVERATGRDLEAYAREKLFEPLGFGPYEWRRDERGAIVPQGNLALRPRDLLKIGLLFEGRGRWGGRQLVPEAWIGEATRSRSVLPSDPATGLGELYRGYGYHWWTGEEHTPAGPRSVYFASGNGGQRLFVVPSVRLVMVVTSAAYGRGYAHRRAHAMLRGVLDAVR